MKLRHSVQAVIIDEKTNNLLLIRKMDFRRNKIVWRLVKGGVEKGETERQALKREIEEEVGLKEVQILDKIFNYDFVFGDRKHLVSTYIVKADSNEKVVLGTDSDIYGKRDILESRWITKEDALEMVYWDNEKEAIKQL